MSSFSFFSVLITMEKTSVRLDLLHKQLLELGTLSGFKHFDVWMKGKEEVMLTVFCTEKQTTLTFLMTAYSQYQCPYVWLKSDTTDWIEHNTQNPLYLQSTARWSTEPVDVWEILADILLSLNTTTSPFALDRDALSSLETRPFLILAWALIQFLERIYTVSQAFWIDQISADLQWLWDQVIQDNLGLALLRGH
ncbi:hypothetical protein BY458DRAFT_508060 [Sporodiniella umbellata]|nr:hypothetical protein BY458DRAFT_508060 [Sporodiniella umbellata]